MTESLDYRVDGPVLLDDVPEEVYHAGLVKTPGPQISQTGLKRLIPPSTPREFQWHLLHPPAPQRRFDVGTAAHSLVLGRGAEFVPCPEDYLSADRRMTTTKAKGWCHEQRTAGVIPLHPDDYEAVHRMADAILANPRAADLVTDPARRSEVSAFCEITPGLWLRSRFDLLGGGLCDFKTAARPKPDDFRRAAWDFGYHVQDVAYRQAWQLVTGAADPGPMTFLIVGKEPPHLVSICTLDTQFEALGRAQFEAAVESYLRQMAMYGAPDADGVVWEGLPAETALLSPPRYAFRDAEGVEYEPEFY